EGEQINRNKTFKVKEKDKEDKEVEKTVTRQIDNFQIGDTVDVHQRILEGQKERIQVFSGVVIARKGEGMRESFTVRRIVQSEGVERVSPLQSPGIARGEVKRPGAARGAKLYSLRDRVGKATRLRERRPKPAPSKIADKPTPTTGEKK